MPKHWQLVKRRANLRPYVSSSLSFMIHLFLLHLYQSSPIMALVSFSHSNPHKRKCRAFQNMWFLHKFIPSFNLAFDCGPLTDPANGRVSVTSSLIGGTATYDCDPDFTLDGNAQRSCTTTGWSGQDPVCRRKYLLPYSAKFRGAQFSGLCNFTHFVETIFTDH